MRRGIPKGAHLLEAPLRLISLVTFLFSDKKVTPIVVRFCYRQELILAVISRTLFCMVVSPALRAASTFRMACRTVV